MDKEIFRGGEMTNEESLKAENESLKKELIEVYEDILKFKYNREAELDHGDYPYENKALASDIAQRLLKLQSNNKLARYCIEILKDSAYWGLTDIEVYEDFILGDFIPGKNGYSNSSYILEIRNILEKIFNEEEKQND